MSPSSNCFLYISYALFIWFTRSVYFLIDLEFLSYDFAMSSACCLMSCASKSFLALSRFFSICVVVDVVLLSWSCMLLYSDSLCLSLSVAEESCFADFVPSDMPVTSTAIPAVRAVTPTSNAPIGFAATAAVSMFTAAVIALTAAGMTTNAATSPSTATVTVTITALSADADALPPLSHVTKLVMPLTSDVRDLANGDTAPLTRPLIALFRSLTVSPSSTPASTVSSVMTTPRSCARPRSSSMLPAVWLSTGISSCALLPNTSVASVDLSTPCSILLKADSVSLSISSCDFMFPLESLIDTPSLSNAVVAPVAAFAVNSCNDFMPMPKLSRDAPFCLNAWSSSWNVSRVSPSDWLILSTLSVA